MRPLPGLLRRHPATFFLVDEAFIDLGGQSVTSLVEHHANLLVTRTLSKAHSLAGLPLARPRQAAALATLRNGGKIRERIVKLRAWTDRLAADLRALGARTYPTETYFFLADFAPRDATHLAERLRERGILVKPLGDRRLGPGFMGVTTARPADNDRFLRALRALL